MNKKNVHDGHRERKRKDFLNRDFESMPEHEILEILLYYSREQGDTNDIAHDLINTFGSLENVFSAHYEDLIKVNGVGERTAVMLILFARLSLRYAAYLSEEKADVDNGEIARSLINEFKHKTKEKVIALYFDDSGKLMNKVPICDGDVDEASFRVRDVVEAAFRCQGKKIILVHNHPQGLAVPSVGDIETTKNVKRALWPLGLELIDHWIIAGDDCLSLKNDKKYSYLF